ncbi:MAG TPA: aminotransferase class I/II-fold pyridoxal phosphate-dependent enzyme, partial [candidate division Zixibacteria bacterium]|nr:aminotransferase class I/II-fold pyridoxal phosphate-dependent enzyme [candidate division Zixibacteria bacterium]
MTLADTKLKQKGELSALVESVTSSQTMAISALAARLSAEGKDIIALSAGELACPTPDSAKEAGIAAIKNNHSGYTINSGTLELRRAICNKYRRELGLEFTVDQVIVTAGAKQAIHEVIMTLCGPGDEVVVFTPYWVSYPEQIRLAGARMVEVQTALADEFIPDPAQFERALTDNTKLVILNSPGNPTGAVYPQEIIERIVGLCAERGIWILTDEIYEKIVFPPHKHISPAQVSTADPERMIIVNGFSKTYAMTGWRVGYALGPERVIKVCSRIQSHTTSNACSISQQAALGAMQGD